MDEMMQARFIGAGSERMWPCCKSTIRPPIRWAIRAMLMQQLDALGNDFSVRALVLTGTGHAFCSGDDLKEQEAAATAPESVRNARLADFARMSTRVESFRAPVIAAINGWCVGGGLELAICCDIRVASTETRITCAGVNVGLIASAYRLPHLIGVARAKHMLRRFRKKPQDAQPPMPTPTVRNGP